jgi:signal transduction histidine kinase
LNLPVTIAQDVTAAGFVALALAISYRWYRERGRAQGWLACSLISLGAVAALGRFQDSQHPNMIVSVISVVAFLASAYFVLLFRNAFIPLARKWRLAADILFAVSIVTSTALVTILQHASQPVLTALTFEFVAAWAIFIGEPIVRFWLASNRLPAVQKARLRFLSLGFAVLIAIVTVNVLGGSALQSPTGVIITQLLALATVPVIYVSFAPPSIVRRLWRMSEENQIRDAMQDLLIFSPTRHALAERAAYWAVRLVGATAGYLVDADGTIMATAGIDSARAAAMNADGQSGRARFAPTVVSAPLHLTDGKGTLVVVGGPYTPLFGSDEISQLRAYANSVSAGLERARVTERIAALENSKTQFLNLASHELRAPLTVIRGYVSMLKSGLFGSLNASGRKASDVMAAKVSEMNELIEEMIDAARLEDGGLSLRAVDADLREIATSAVEMVTPLLGDSHRIVLDVPERRVRVTVDPDRTKTIITNLLTNAIKYSPQGGEVTCHVRAQRGGVAKVSVSDEGLGIAREHISVLFTRFGRIVTPETEHLRGTGLGLFLSRQLARLQGGDITVVSEPGEGSTFTLQLPAHVAASHPASSDEDSGTSPLPAATASRQTAS